MGFGGEGGQWYPVMGRRESKMGLCNYSHIGQNKKRSEEGDEKRKGWRRRDDSGKLWVESWCEGVWRI